MKDKGHREWEGRENLQTMVLVSPVKGEEVGKRLGRKSLRYFCSAALRKSQPAQTGSAVIKTAHRGACELERPGIRSLVVIVLSP